MARYWSRRSGVDVVYGADQSAVSGRTRPASAVPGPKYRNRSAVAAVVRSCGIWAPDPGSLNALAW